jgi:hypothetical protein
MDLDLDLGLEMGRDVDTNMDVKSWEEYEGKLRFICRGWPIYSEALQRSGLRDSPLRDKC